MDNSSAFELRGESDVTGRKKRNVFLRTLVAWMWFIGIYFLSNVLIGAIVGGIADAGTSSFEEGAVAGRAASIAFFQRYGIFVLMAQVFVTLLLIFAGLLPGTGKYKRLSHITRQ